MYGSIVRYGAYKPWRWYCRTSAEGSRDVDVVAALVHAQQDANVSRQAAGCAVRVLGHVSARIGGSGAGSQGDDGLI